MSVDAQRGSGRPAPSQGVRAASALAVGSGLAAVMVALSPVPAHWLDAEHTLSATAADPSPLLGVWHGLARTLPVAALPMRVDLIAALLVLLNAAAAINVAFSLFRGPGRWLAAVLAGPICALALVRWALAVGTADAVPGLVVSVLSTLALAPVVRARVHFGRVTPVAVARAIAPAAAIALVDGPAALVLLLLTIPMAAAITRRRRADGGRSPAPTAVGHARRKWLAAAAFGAAPALAGCAVALAIGGPAPAPDWSTTVVTWPDLAMLAQPEVGRLVYPAAAMLILMVFVLRWRGGPWLAVWAVVPLVTYDSTGPWVPHSVVLVIVAVAVSGWVWLAASVTPRRAWVARGSAVLAAVGIVALALGGSSESLDPRMRPTVAQARPTGSLVSVYTRGLLAPGDVLIAHDPWLHDALSDRRLVEGWRPDVALLDAQRVSDEDLARLSLDWRSTGRRILSDSWNLGGRWNASWAVDSGPLFWFVGATDPAEREFTDLAGLWAPPNSRPPERMRRWQRLAIERCRFRRAVDEPQSALAALPLDSRRYRGLLTRLQLARTARTDEAAGSELPGTLELATDPVAFDEALILAEAGDLLFAHGEQERASELLIESANAGYVPAWGALARWQLRAGSTTAAAATMEAIGGAPALRGEAVAVLHWLLSRDRIADAREMVTVLEPSREASVHDAALEIAARLRLLDALARPVPREPGDPSPTEFTQR